MPNTQKIKDFLEQYKNNFTQYWLNEKYKWQAIKCFQDNWNIDATNFYTMFKNALDKTQNLLTSHNFFAKEMILEFIKIEPENVREMFRNLFDEEESLNQRINNFINSSNILKEKNSKWKNHYQNMTAISTYLWLKYPDKYYICKYLECKNIINIFDFNIDLKDGDTANNILSCIDVYDEICAILSKNNELIELFRSCLTQDCYFDPLFKTLTIDFCFQCYIKFNHQEKNYWLYAPGENAKYWDKFYKEGIMAIGWDYLGDLNNYNDKKSLSEKMQNIHNWTSYPRNNVSTLWSFRNDIKPGDIIFVKNGVSNIVGRGVVLSDYIYDSKREDEYKNIRKVYWTHKGRWQYSKNLPQKTLTNISQPSINELENLLTDSNDEIKK